MVIFGCKRLETVAAQINRMVHNYVEVMFTELQKKVTYLSELFTYHLCGHQ